jgi:hypothetical protein
VANRRTPNAAAAALQRSVDAALQSYADRGVFRGFSAAEGPRGTRQYRFTWLTRRPTTVIFARASATLSFAALFPHVAGAPGVVASLREEVRYRTTSAVPVHRRIDRRRAEVATTLREGALSLRVRLKGRDGTAAVRATLALVNDLFLLLQERYPEYLVAYFGFKDE